MRYHVITDIRGRMTTKGPQAPAMLGHPDIMVFVLVVFWCVTLCDFVTCYSGYKNLSIQLQVPMYVLYVFQKSQSHRASQRVINNTLEASSLQMYLCSRGTTARLHRSCISHHT